MNYKSIIESAYNRGKWQTLLHDIFGNRVDFYAPAHRLDLGKSLLKESWFLGAITLSDGQKIGIYEGELADSVGQNEIGNVKMPLITERNRMALCGAVDRILAAKNENPNADTSALESEIDQLVYKLYGLTPEEIAVVESAVGGKS